MSTNAAEQTSTGGDEGLLRCDCGPPRGLQPRGKNAHPTNRAEGTGLFYTPGRTTLTYCLARKVREEDVARTRVSGGPAERECSVKTTGGGCEALVFADEVSGGTFAARGDRGGERIERLAEADGVPGPSVVARDGEPVMGR